MSDDKSVAAHGKAKSGRRVAGSVLRFLLVDAELELVPSEVAGHPQVRAHAKIQNKSPGDLLLDQNAHRQACKKLDDGDRRGRPDIVQYTLLSLMESPLCKEGRLEVAVHTRDGTLVRIRPDTRLPRGESRFHGLLAKVLRDGASQDRDPLLWSEGVRSPTEALAAFAAGPVLRLDETGTTTLPAALATRAVDGELTLVLGAFPRGDYSEGWQDAAPETASIHPEALNAWAVAAECAAGFRAAHPA